MSSKPSFENTEKCFCSIHQGSGSCSHDTILPPAELIEGKYGLRLVIMTLAILLFAFATRGVLIPCFMVITGALNSVSHRQLYTSNVQYSGPVDFDWSKVSKDIGVGKV